MNGLINSERYGLEVRSKWLERSLVLAGAIVIAGLIGESRTISAYLVIVGVFAEVLLGIFITKTSERIQELSNLAVAAANERAAQAEERTAILQVEIADARERQARAEQLIADLRLAQAPRVNTFDFQGFAGYLVNRPKGTAKIFFLEGDTEGYDFANLIYESLRIGGWHLPQRPTEFPHSEGSGRGDGGSVLLFRTRLIPHTKHFWSPSRLSVHPPSQGTPPK
jgi:hypothetical protein